MRLDERGNSIGARITGNNGVGHPSMQLAHQRHETLDSGKMLRVRSDVRQATNVSP